MRHSALVLNIFDNVATAVQALKDGDTIAVEIGDDTTSVVLLQSIPFGHKFALKEIRRGEEIIKYGETIGRATVDIRQGEHVHVHNVEGLRGRGDRP
jgi:altronate dehydratase small subunit